MPKRVETKTSPDSGCTATPNGFIRLMTTVSGFTLSCARAEAFRQAATAARTRQLELIVADRDAFIVNSLSGSRHQDVFVKRAGAARMCDWDRTGRVGGIQFASSSGSDCPRHS